MSSPSERQFSSLELSAIIVVAVCVVCVLVTVMLCVIHRRRPRRPSYDPYDASSLERETLVRGEQKLHELLDDFTQSGSGSGQNQALLDMDSLMMSSFIY